MYDHLFNYLEQFKEISEDDKVALRKYFKPTTRKKGELLVEEGKVCDEILFLNEGYVQVYVMKDVDEHTIHITGPRDFISGYSSFISKTPSDDYLRALTDLEGFTISYPDIQELYGKSILWERFGRNIIERLFVLKQKRVVSFIKDSSEARYQQLMEQNPDFLQNIPLKILASYLGMTPETLSRIRAKMQ